VPQGGDVRLDLNESVFIRLRRVSPHAKVKRPVGAKSRVLMVNQTVECIDAAPRMRSGDLRPERFFLATEPGAGAKTRLTENAGHRPKWATANLSPEGRFWYS
jgi:hypothetical protein